MIHAVSEIDLTKFSVNPESASMAGLISYMLNNSEEILADHSIHDTASKLDSFETFLATFDKFDRRKDESADSKGKYSELRDDKRNNLVASLLDTMRSKIDFFEQEMNIARDIQQNMVPRTMPQANGFEFQGYYQPSRQVGGDYYDLFSTNDDMMYFLISDVSGKGLPSSLVVASMQAYIYAGVKSRKPIAILTQELNNYLTEKLTNEKYVTFFMGMLNLQDGYVQYVNAGHNPPYAIKSDGEIVALESGGPILGMFSDATYKTGSVHLNNGDSLALFTDGIVEAFNEEEEEFTDERLIDIIKREKNKPLEAVVDTILGELKEFCGASPLGDDITLLLIRKQ